MDPTPPTDLTVHVLIEIRDELRKTNQRVDHLTERVDHLTERVDHNFEVLSGRIDATNGRIVESEMRVATAITTLAGTVNDIKTLIIDRLDLRDRVERCERDIDELKRASHRG